MKLKIKKVKKVHPPTTLNHRENTNKDYIAKSHVSGISKLSPNAYIKEQKG